MVEHIFGEVTSFGDDLFKSIVDMIKEIKHLFSIQTIENMFTAPFKRAAVMAISEISKLFEVLSRADAPSIDGIKEKLEAPIKAVYAKMKDGINILIGGFNDIVERLKDGEISFIHDFKREVHSVIALSSGMLDDLASLKGRIAKKFEVLKGEAFSIEQRFAGHFTKASLSVEHSISASGQHSVSPFSSITASVKKRLDNEKAALQSASDFIVVLVIAALLGIFMITKSILVVVVISIILLVAAIILYFVT